MFENNLVMKKKNLVSKHLLIHFDDVDGATRFKDEGNHALGIVGTPSISTVQSKYGGSSGLFDRDGLYVEPAIEAVGDYTIECWVLMSAYPASRGGIAGNRNVGTDHALSIGSTGRLTLWLPTCGFTGTQTSAATSPPTVVVLNEWTHVATSRQGSVIRMFINGRMCFEVTASAKGIVTLSRLMKYAVQDDDISGFKGYVDEYRILDGIAAYTGNFTVPTAPLTLPA
jgi:hypothetical protein